MFWDKWKNNKKGFTILEIIVVIVVVVSVFAAVLSFFTLDVKTSERSRAKLVAISLCEEAIEAVRNFRDNTSWTENGIGILATNTNLYPVVTPSGWLFVLGSENLNNFTRYVVLSRVSRDTNSNIEAIYNPINDDPDTRKVVATVTWTDRYGPASENLTLYITNWKR